MVIELSQPRPVNGIVIPNFFFPVKNNEYLFGNVTIPIRSVPFS